MTIRPESITAEDRQSLWLLVISPSIWAAHFLTSYIWAAVWCGAADHRGGGLGPLRVGIVALAVVSLIGIGLTGRLAWRKHTHPGSGSAQGSNDPPHEADTAEDRHRFLGWATVLLSALSAIATVYVALSVLFIRSCY